MTIKYINKKNILLVLSGLLILIGVYLLTLYLSPKYLPFLKNKSATTSDNNRLIIKSTDISVAIKEGGEEQLEHGAWHRFPDRGNPDIGGNFILSAHSFVWGLTPDQVTNKSYFYRLKEVKEGDDVVVRWNNKDFNYKVEKKFQIKPNQTEIENKSNEAKLTIYTCTEGGSADGRVVVVAKPIK